MLEPLLFFVGLLAVTFCVGIGIGALWQGRWWSLALCASGLALVCTVGGVVWLVQIDPNRSAYDFHTFAGVGVFARNVLIFFVGASTLCFGGGVGGAMAGYLLKVWLRSPNVPPVLPPNR